jgi:hypothetical protein
MEVNMNITRLNVVDGKLLPLDGLLSYLSQIVISKTDEKIVRKKESLEKTKEGLKRSLEKLRTVKERLGFVSTECKRLEALQEVLQLINNLKQEGVIIGANKAKISKLLYTIQDHNIKTLKTLKSKLLMYSSEQQNKITIS